VNDPTNPEHYTSGGIECIDYLEAKLEGRDGFEGFCIGNAIKYLTRADMKGPGIEDYKKARWYVDRLIANREKSDAEADAEVDKAEATLAARDEWALPEGFEWKQHTYGFAILQTHCGYMSYLSDEGHVCGSLDEPYISLMKRRNGVAL
jgi:hypothetical protein